MRTLTIFLSLLLIANFIFAGADVDTLKKNIIDDCQEIDELGRCVPENEPENVIEKGTKLTNNLSESVTYGLGLEDDYGGFLITVILIIVVCIAGLFFIINLLGGN